MLNDEECAAIADEAANVAERFRPTAYSAFECNLIRAGVAFGMERAAQICEQQDMATDMECAAAIRAAAKGE